MTSSTHASGTPNCWLRTFRALAPACNAGSVVTILAYGPVTRTNPNPELDSDNVTSIVGFCSEMEWTSKPGPRLATEAGTFAVTGP